MDATCGKGEVIFLHVYQAKHNKIHLDILNFKRKESLLFLNREKPRKVTTKVEKKDSIGFSI